MRIRHEWCLVSSATKRSGGDAQCKEWSEFEPKLWLQHCLTDSVFPSIKHSSQVPCSRPAGNSRPAAALSCRPNNMVILVMTCHDRIMILFTRTVMIQVKFERSFGSLRRIEHRTTQKPRAFKDPPTPLHVEGRSRPRTRSRHDGFFD
jgi:hypothetical protein